MNPDWENFSATQFLVRTIKRVRGWTWEAMEQATGVSVSLLVRYANGARTPSPETVDRILIGSGIRTDLKDSVLAAMGALSDLAAAFSGDAQPPSPFLFEELLAEIQEAVQAAVAVADKPALVSAADPADQLRRLLSCEPADRPHVARMALEFHSFALCELCCEESLRHAAQDPQRAGELAELARSIAEELFFPPLDQPGLDAEAESYAAAAAEIARALGNDVGLLYSDRIRARALAARRQHSPARRLFEEVRRGFVAADLHYDAILSTLELIAHLLEAPGQKSAALQAARSLQPLLQSKQLHPEPLSALRAFYDALSGDEASAELTSSLLAYLHRSRHSPSAQL